MKAAGVVLALVLALALQTTLGRFVLRGVPAIDLVLVAVVYVGLASGPATGLVAGTIGGLAQDALSSGIIGVGGLAKTVVGYLAGLVGTHFIVAQPFPRFVVFFAATLVHAALFIGLYVLLGLREFGSPYATVTGQAIGNALAGVVAFQLAELLPGAVERRRSQRAKIRK